MPKIQFDFNVERFYDKVCYWNKWINLIKYLFDFNNGDIYSQDHKGYNW